MCICVYVFMRARVLVCVYVRMCVSVQPLFLLPVGLYKHVLFISTISTSTMTK
eukprot:m.87647 g.87647  ORF g.87647 m.87647 type:complete len:53 (+) comp26101_c0_seq2:3-161(+)